MATYEGTEIPVGNTTRHNALLLNSEWEKRCFKWYMSGEKSHGGSYSLAICPGGVFDIDYGSDAGSHMIEVWVWPPTGQKVRIEVINPMTHAIVASGSPAGSGAWEKVEINFTAEKKVYVLRLRNMTPANGDSRAWFDDIA